MYRNYRGKILKKSHVENTAYIEQFEEKSPGEANKPSKVFKRLAVLNP